MPFDSGRDYIPDQQSDAVYLKRRVRDEADAAARAGTMAATLIHVALATAYARRCCRADDQAWVAQSRLW